MNNRISLIAPYSDLKELSINLNSEYKWDIDIKLGNLEDAISLAKDAEKNGAQVIISRGGTALILKKNINIPVVEIKVTGYDLLKVLKPFQNNKEFIGIVGYKNVIEGCRTICNLLNIPIKEIIIPNEGHRDWNLIKRKVIEMIETDNVHTIVGDTVVASKFKELSLDFNLIVSGKESIIQAVEEAEIAIEAIEKEKEKSEMFKAVLNFIHDAVISIDELGIIKVVNRYAEDIFGYSQEEMIGKHIKNIIENNIIEKVLEKGVPDMNRIVNTPSGQVIINSIPILVDKNTKGVVATFQKISKIQKSEQKIRQALFTKGLITKYTFEDIITKDKRMIRLIEIAKDYAKTNATVLISGESGTGKELLAQGIHRNSTRFEGPFVAVNCAALPSQLLESELFGYVEGAFTGAKKLGKIGLFELAHKGTIFLDEIGDMDKQLQGRLLRVIQERQVMRLGSDKIVPVDIRIIAATNSNLKKLVRENKFREDLYYRLSVLNLKTISVRERKCDIGLLCNFFLSHFSKLYNRQTKILGEDVMNLFYKHSWPGNIRELRNVIERIVVSTNKQCIELEDVDLLIDGIEDLEEKKLKEKNPYPIDDLLQGTMNDIKRNIIKRVLQEENNNKTRAAERLNIDRSTIGRLLQ